MYLKTTIKSPLAIPSCEICGRSKASEIESLQMVQNILLDEQSKRKSQEEEQRSKEQFQGFNIYGNSRNPTSTLKHLT